MLQTHVLVPSPVLCATCHTNDLKIVPGVPLPILPKTAHLLLIRQGGIKQMRMQVPPRLQMLQPHNAPTRDRGTYFLEGALVAFLDHPQAPLVVLPTMAGHCLLARAGAPVDLVTVQVIFAVDVLELDDAAVGQGILCFFFLVGC